MAPQHIALVLVLSCALGIVPFQGAVQPALAWDTSADDVVDRDSLKAFVERAREDTETAVPVPAAAYDFFDREFRPHGEWNNGPVYIFVLETDGDVVFHGANRALEQTNLWNLEDRNGVFIVRELVAAARRGGDFVEYYFDNPDVVGDEETGSFKIGYAVLLTLGSEQYMFGSGFYPASPAPVVPPAALLLLGILLAGGYLRRQR